MSSITDLLNNKSSFQNDQKSPGFIQGIVVENNNQEYKGQVKVEFAVREGGENTCEWVRLLASYGGPGYGNYVVPEINDIVLVGFIGQSPKHPFLLGSLYPAGNEMVNESFHEKNHVKHIKTKGGMDVLIQDEEGKQSITVTTPKGSVIVMEDETETCMVADKGNRNSLLLDYRNGSVKMNAEKNITLKAGGVELVLEGERGKFSLKADSAEVKGGNSVKLEAGGSLSLKGGTSDLEGSQSVTVKGRAQTVISGGIVKIN